MATGIIAVLSATTSVTYTPQTDSKVQVVLSGSSFTVNGVTIATTSFVVYCGAGQTTVFAAGGATQACISALES